MSDMKAYPIDKIRNVVLAGHGGTGKTSLVEAMLFTAGTITRLGKVDDGSSHSDFDADEIAKRMSLSAAVLPCEWKNIKINTIDTPGYPDFIGEVIGSMRAVEAAVIVLDGHGAVEVGTDNAWDTAEASGISKVFFVNKLEKENMDFYSTLEALRKRFGVNVAPIQLPIGAEAGFKGVVDLLTQKAYVWENATMSQVDIPGDMVEQIAASRESLIESVAEMDDALMEKFFEEGTLSDSELERGLELGVRTGKFVPVLCGSATKMVGIQTLLDFITVVVPSPAAVPVVEGKNPAGTDEKRNPTDPFSALVFKTMADPFVGKLTYFRVYSGSIKSDSHVFNSVRNKEERVGQVFFLLGKSQSGTTEIGAGDIGAVAKLADTLTGDTLCEKSKQIVLKPIEFPDPVYGIAVRAKTKADEDKLGPALHKMGEEDKTFKTHREPETGQTIMSGLGDTHLNIVVERLKRKFGVEVETEKPKIAYREAITKKAEAQGRHKKQSGGAGQFGDCWIRIEPQERGAGYEFVDAIVGGSIPRQYIPAVDKGVREALVHGILAGNPVVDIKVTCFDGSYHPVDSKDIAFQMAGKTAFRTAAEKAGPVILEPIMELEVTVPEDYMGDIIGDINSKRGRVGGMEPVGSRRQMIKATVPQSELLNYCIDLRSIARGRGKFTMKFSHYEEAPPLAAQQIIAAAEKAKEEKAS